MSDLPSQPPQWGEKLSGLNAAIWRTSTTTTQMRSAMTALFLLETVPDPKVLRDRMDRVTRTYPALRGRLVEPVGPLGQPRLVVDPEFDIDFHTVHYSLPAPGDWRMLLQHARRHSMTDLDRDRALWRATLMDGLPGGRAAITLVVHHAIADGQGMVMLGAGLLDFTPASSVAHAPMPPAPRPGRVDRGSATLAALGSAAKRGGTTGVKTLAMVPGTARSLIEAPVETTAEAVGMATSMARMSRLYANPLSPLMTGRGGTYTPRTLDIPFDALRAAATDHGGTLNEVFLAAVTGGVRRYHEEHGFAVGNLRVNVPISLRSAGDQATGNAVATARLELDASEVDVQTRVDQAKDVVGQARVEPFLPHIDFLADVVRLAPVEVTVMLTTSSDVTASNVPGVPVPVFLGGAKVDRVYALVPTLGAAVNITMLSYAKQWCSLGIDTDDAAIPDPDVFLRCLAEGFAEVGAPPRENATDPIAPSEQGGLGAARAARRRTPKASTSAMARTASTRGDHS